MKKVKKMRMGKRVTAWFIFLMMCVTLLPANVTVFARDYITVNYVVNGVTLRTEQLPTGTYIQVANRVPYVSSLIAGTAYADYDYGTVTNIECRPLQYFPGSALSLHEGQNIEHSKNYGTHTITYTTSKWEKHTSSSVTPTTPGTGGSTGSGSISVTARPVYVDAAGNATIQSVTKTIKLSCGYTSKYHSHGTNCDLYASGLNNDFFAVPSDYTRFAWGRSVTGVGTRYTSYSGTVLWNSGQEFYIFYKLPAAPASYGYQLNWDYNGGTLNSQDFDQESALNQTNGSHTFYEQVSKRPSREGYTFNGWTYSGNGAYTKSNGQIVMNGTDGSTVSGTMTAQWTVNPSAKAKLTYDANGGSNPPAEQTVSLGSEDTVSDKGSMTKSGYTFLGWSRDKNATEADIVPNDVLRMDGDITLYAVWEENTTKLIETKFTIQLAFFYLENGRADIPDDFALEMEITNENVPDFKFTKTLHKSEAEETTNTAPALTWTLKAELPQSYEDAGVLDDEQAIKAGSAELYGRNAMKLTAVNGDVEGYQYTMRDNGHDASDAMQGKENRTLILLQAGSTSVHHQRIFNTYVIPYQSTHYYYDSVEDYNNNDVLGTTTIKTDGSSSKRHLKTGTKAWGAITDEKTTYSGQKYIAVKKPENLAVTQATKNFELKYVRSITVKWVDEDGNTVKSENIPNGADYSDLYPEDKPSDTGKWGDPVKDASDNITISWTEPPVVVYTVTYKDGVGGKVFADQKHENLRSGADTPEFEGTPSRDGYVFDGWDSEVAKTVTGDATYTAIWKEDKNNNGEDDEKEPKYTVIYTDGVGGDAFDDQEYEDLLSGDPTPGFVGPKTREDYVFAGWEPVVADTVTGNATYTAIWKDDKNNNGTADEDEPYTVTYTDGVEDEDIFEDSVFYDLLYGDETPEFGEDPIRDGYTFNGWSPEVSDTVTGTVVYTARWENNSPAVEEPQYLTVKYVDGVDGKAFDDQSYTVEEGVETPEFVGEPSRDGYVFDGWNPEVADTVTENVTYTAKWHKTHKVTWVEPEENEVIDVKEDVRDGDDVDEEEYPTPPAAPEGKEFDGWEKGDPDENGDVVITVVWKDAEKTYTLSYNATEGTGAPADQSETTTEDSATFTVSNGVPVREGYTFEGWTENVRARGPLYTGGNEITIFEDTTLYAVWTANEEPDDPNKSDETYTVTWVDGHTDTPIKNLPGVKDGQDITDEYPEDPTRDGYTFEGWQVGEPDEDGNITITATWKRKVNNIGGSTPDGGTTGGGGSTGGGTPTRPSGSNPTGGTNGGGLVDISDPSVPLAAAPGLNNTDHFAYIIGYVDGTVRPENNISRAEVATIFFRLMTEEFRNANWSSENGFSDVAAEAWYNNAISTGVNAGIIKGHDDGSFAPEDAITRAEFAAIAARFLSDDAPSTGAFDDVAGHWAEDEINRAVAAGWIRGKGDNKFAPDEYITRAEVMTLVNRMLDRVGDEEAMLDDMVKWVDNPESAWYYADVQEATNGHNYDRDELGIAEIWTGLTPNRDWSELER